MLNFKKVRYNDNESVFIMRRQSVLNEKKIFNLSDAQREILSVEEFYPKTSSTNLAAVVFYTGATYKNLQKAVNSLLQYNGILRTQIFSGNKTVQKISDFRKIKLNCIFFSNKKELFDWANSEVLRPVFDFDKCLYKFCVLKCGDQLMTNSNLR